MVHRLFAVILAAMVFAPGTLSAQDPSAGAPPGIMHIDGARNPELIPQWSAWGYAFRVIAGGPRELPSVVHQVVSMDEAALMLREADAVQKIDSSCQERVLKLHPLVGKEDAAVLDARLREITLECRRATLRARDRILEALNPEAGAALIMFVESTKSGTSLSIRKRDLPRFLEPE